jgi:hypothetical protein
MSQCVAPIGVQDGDIGGLGKEADRLAGWFGRSWPYEPVIATFGKPRAAAYRRQLKFAWRINWPSWVARAAYPCT